MNPRLETETPTQDMLDMSFDCNNNTPPAFAVIIFRITKNMKGGGKHKVQGIIT